MIFFVTKYFLLFYPSWLLVWSVIHANFILPIVSFVSFLFFAYVVEYFYLRYPVCLIISFDIFRFHHFYIFKHFYLSYFLWKKRFLRTRRQKKFLFLRWILFIAPAFYCCIFLLIVSHYCVSCFIYSLLLIWYKFLLIFFPIRASVVKEHIESFISYFVDVFVNYILFIIAFLSIYRFFLHLLFKFITFIDLVCLRILQFLFGIVLDIIFYSKIYWWKFFHFRRWFRWHYWYYKKFIRDPYTIPYRLLIIIIRFFKKFLSLYVKFRLYLCKFYGLIFYIYLSFVCAYVTFFFYHVVCYFKFYFWFDFVWYLFAFFRFCVLLLIKLVIVSYLSDYDFNFIFFSSISFLFLPFVVLKHSFFNLCLMGIALLFQFGFVDPGTYVSIGMFVFMISVFLFLFLFFAWCLYNLLRFLIQK